MALITRYIQELQINGQNIDDDFNVGEDDNTTPNDIADDAAEENEDYDDEDDEFTLEDDEEIDDVPEENEENDTTPEGNDDDGAADKDNFTVDDGGHDGEEDDGEQPEPTTEKKAPSNPTDGIDDEDQRASEETIYNSLTDDQKRIRVLQLKIDYKDLYETIMNTMDSINSIPKTVNNIETIKRLTTFLTKAKLILIDYIKNNFDKNSYLDNYTMYIKYLAVFRTTAKVIEELNNEK